MNFRFRPAIAACLIAALPACTVQAPVAPRPAATAQAPHQIAVTAANPLAAKAGMDVLRRGGSAVDAAIAVQAMLGLVEPQSSGLGGGAFLTYYDAKTHKVTVLDGREKAPMGASPDMFLGSDGKPLPHLTGVMGGRATGVPGAVAMLKLAHDKWGKLPWGGLFEDTAKLAEHGFTVSPRLAEMVHSHFPENSAPDVIAYFSKPDGTLVGAGDTLKNPAYAAFLRRLAQQGPDALYKGETARAIVARTHLAPLPGTMTLADLASYRPEVREPVCRPHRIYIICVPPPPSSGVGLLELLAILDHTDIATRGPDDPRAWFEFGEASRLMYADRDRYVGDPAFVSVPVAGLLDPAYIARRAAKIGTNAMPAPAAGTPAGAPDPGPDHTAEPGGTSHFVIIDADGNAVSMTTTVEFIFGSGRMVDGFFLNNQLTDFSFSPTDSDGRPAANAVAPGKRPRSSMTPAILLDADGDLAGAIGSPGGNSIIAYVGKAIVGFADWKLPMSQAIALPNLIARGDSFDAELSRMSPGLAAALRARGMPLKTGTGEGSGLQGLLVTPQGITGGADPRREGVVLVEAAPAQ
jgi:gamma-glutamyltranspeptidase/glutathione hydrolase